MTERTLVVFTGDKGRVGRSTPAVLMTEWRLSNGKQVQLVGAHPDQTSKIWAEKCEALGYRVGTPDAPVTVVETAGTSGAGLNRYILQADVIAVPFQSHVADLEPVLGWFLTATAGLRRRMAFVPNRLTNTKEQGDGLEELRNIVKGRGRGKLAPGLSNRPEVYPPMLNGRKEHFFTRPMDVKVKDEGQATCESLMKR